MAIILLFIELKYTAGVLKQFVSCCKLELNRGLPNNNNNCNCNKNVPDLQNDVHSVLFGPLGSGDVSSLIRLPFTMQDWSAI